MYWPDTQTGVDVEPARKPVASAVRKFFTEGGLGQAPTVPGGDWFNQITNELLNVLAAAGIDPSKTDDDQLLQAINGISKALSAREALRRTYAEAGYALVPGSFELGGTVSTATDVLLYEADGKAYSFSGTLPHTVDGDSAPSDEPGMWTDRSSAPNSFKQSGTGAVLRPAQDKMGESVSVLDFTGTTDDRKFINALTYLNDSGGGTLRINRGVNFLIEDTILSPILSGDIDIYFEPGSVLTAAPGLSVPVLNMLASGSTITDRILRIFNPRIDCSNGFTGGPGQACTAISAQYFKQFIVEYPNLFGGDDYRNTNADSGITPICCDYFSLLGGLIRGFSDGGVYIGGDDTAGLTGDTISSIIIGTNFERCATAVAAKRDLNLLKVTHAHVTECLAGVVPSEITTPSYTNPARRLHVTDCHFKKIGSQAARFRGPTKGIFARNHIEDWGYESDGVTPLVGSAYALAIQGSSGIDVDGNEYKLVDWASNDQRAVLQENITLNSVAYTQGGNHFSNNKYRDIPRVLVEAPGGNPSTYLHEHYDNITASKFSGLNTASLVLYREDSSDRLWSLLHGVVQPVGRAPIVAHTSAVTLLSTDSGGVYTNVGATTLVALTLPGAAAGLTYEFACMDTDGLRITAAAGDNIRISGSVSSSGGTATSTTVGTTLKLTALDSTNWVADYVTGTWALA